LKTIVRQRECGGLIFRWKISRLPWVRGLVLVAGLMRAAGCGKSPAPMPAADSTQTTETPAPTGPTTQEFMAAPFVDISLRPLPLHAKVPRSWGIEDIRGTDITLLHGLGPAGNQLDIQLSVLMSMTPQRVDLMLQAAQRDAKKDPATILCNVHQTTDTQVLEIQRVMKAATQPADKPIDWKITYFVQHDLNYDAYMLSVIGLTQRQYEQSKDLLRRIIDSVTYVPSGV
jgi:hypothetical protein